MGTKGYRGSRAGFPEPPELERTQIFGWRLWLARSCVFALISLSVILFVLGLSHRLDELTLLRLFTESDLYSLIGEQQQGYQSARSLLAAYPIGAIGIEILLMGLMMIAAAIVIWRKSNDQVALLLAVGLVTYGAYISPTIDALIVARPEFTLLANVVQASGLLTSMLFLYTFPNGRFVPFFTAYLFVIWIAWSLAWVINPSLPINQSRPFDLPLNWFLVLMAWWATGVLAQFYRYGHVSNPVERQQTKFIVFGVLLVLIGYVLYLPTHYLLPPSSEQSFARILFNLTGVPLFLLLVFAAPQTVTFSILRFRLWDIDVVINRTVVYGLLTGVLGLLYAGSILVLQFIFQALTDQRQSEIVTAISTLLIAALFQPVRNRIQNVIARSFYRRKYDAEKTVAQFGELMRTEVDLERLTAGLQRVLQDTMQPEHISLQLLRTGGVSSTRRAVQDIAGSAAPPR